jgi:glutamate synthase (NADPH) large chain
MNNFEKNKKLLQDNHSYNPNMEHDACGVGMIAATNGKKSRKIVEYGIEALKAIWHRGAVDADGKSGDGAGIQIEIAPDFFKEKILATGHTPDDSKRICVGMVFLPRTDYGEQEKCREIIESVLLEKNFYIYGWRQVPFNSKVLGKTAEQSRPEIVQVMFKKNENLETNNLERNLFETRKKIEKLARENQLKNFYICSFSSRSIVYKGMFLAESLADFYLDLNDKNLTSRFAIFHQRYSTNTFPSWDLAQPFRTLAHNGEINTLKGNINWMKIHEQDMSSPLFENVKDLKPVIRSSSDSGALDNVFELLTHSGKLAPLIKLMMIPDSWSKRSKTVPKNHQDLFNFLNSTIEPWDGPAAICATDSKWVLAATDRNGLRPLRYTITSDDLFFAGSESGMIKIPEEKIISKGKLGPGQIIAIDLKKGKLFKDKEIKDFLAKDYKKYSKQIVDLEKKIFSVTEKVNFTGEELKKRQYLSGLSIEDLELILHPMAEEGKEASGSMGDDTPVAVLSSHFRPVSHYFRQNFSQVTNPPIDSLRESKVMSLKTRFGNLGNILDFDNLTEEDIYVLDSPILTNSQFKKFNKIFSKKIKIIECTFDIKLSLKDRIETIKEECETAVREGSATLILSDKNISKDKASIPTILAVGAVHSHLVKLGLRGYCSLNVESSDALDTHSFAVLIGVGATTVNPYLAIDCIHQRFEKKLFGKLDFQECVQKFKKSIDAGLLKIMSKMGISVISSYRGGCNFEAVGLSRAIVSDYFPGMSSRISGIGIIGIEKKIKELHSKFNKKNIYTLPIGGLYRYRKSGEDHQNQGNLIHLLQSAVGNKSYDQYKKYSAGIHGLPPINIRDLLKIKNKREPINVHEVEPIEEILKRFGSGSMSHGALSAEAHETLAIGMNRIKGASCSGEGGEDAKRFKILPNGDSANSRVKQVASARFGVTVDYLNNANEIEIKMAQGAKPGEGGQLPGFKVNDEIARLRHSTPGVTLISPPPHHDIYSIEDLAQLIYDLKQINPGARVGVKLVASTGIGTIAAGVAKAKADIILISGHSGGTGASPQTSIKYAGIPWEMGLTETNQILTLNNLRHQVTLRTDGGLKTGRDIVMAAMMGAEEYGMGTSSLIAMGCIMVRQCHSNTCPVGVCSQDKALREKFSGTAEKVVNLFTFVATEVREILASIGYKSINEIIGRTDLLSQVNKGAPNLDDLDLNPLLVQADPGDNPRYCKEKIINKVPDTLDEKIWSEIKEKINQKEKNYFEYNTENTFRSVGTRLSHYIYKKFGNNQLDEDTVNIKLIGSAGQSLGAFLTKGIKLLVEGDCNDYVGKGLSGGTIVAYPSPNSKLISSENTIIGNTVLYGATSGKLYASGQAGERFAVRNSGCLAIVEGCGAHGCEYMTGGTAIILGQVGDNFGAGMTGGMAFIYDKENNFENYVNSSSIIWQSVETDYWKKFLKNNLRNFVKETQSSLAKKILNDYEKELKYFKQVCPIEMLDKLDNPITLKPTIKKVS